MAGCEVWKIHEDRIDAYRVVAEVDRESGSVGVGPIAGGVGEYQVVPAIGGHEEESVVAAILNLAEGNLWPNSCHNAGCALWPREEWRELFRITFANVLDSCTRDRVRLQLSEGIAAACKEGCSRGAHEQRETRLHYDSHLRERPKIGEPTQRRRRLPLRRPSLVRVSAWLGDVGWCEAIRNCSERQLASIARSVEMWWQASLPELTEMTLIVSE